MITVMQTNRTEKKTTTGQSDFTVCYLLSCMFLPYTIHCRAWMNKRAKGPETPVWNFLWHPRTWLLIGLGLILLCICGALV
jgi:hypothetical protein